MSMIVTIWCVLAGALQLSGGDLFDRGGGGNLSAPEVLELPRPTGRFPVGTYLTAVADSARREIFTADPDDYRRVPVRVYFPAAEGCSPQPYLPPATSAFYRAGLGAEEGFEGRLHAHACRDAQFAPGQEKYPVILFSHGLGFTHSFYTSLLEDLASHGNIVVAIDHTHGIPAALFPDGSLVLRDNSRWEGENAPRAAAEYYRNWAADARGVIDRIMRNDRTVLMEALAGRADTGRLVYTGHSFGGLAALYAAQVDRRIKGAVNLDGIVGTVTNRDGTEQPARMLVPVAAEVPLLVLNQTRTDEREFYSDATRVVRVQGTTHMTFSDILWLGEKFGRVTPGSGANGTTLPAEQGIRITREILLRFLPCAFNGDCAGLDGALDAVRVPSGE